MRPPNAGSQRATRLVFLACGIGNATWAALVPLAKARADISDGALGLLLLCLGIGSIGTMPIAGALAARLGCRRVIAASALLAAASLPVLATASDPAILAPALAVFGGGIGGVDVVMNIQAIEVERASGRAMMSRFHGLFSLGGILGAGGMAALLASRLPPLAATGVADLVLLGLLAAALPACLGPAPTPDPAQARPKAPAFAIPRGIVLTIAVFCFVLFLVEGAVLDWSGVFLTQIRHRPASVAPLGYAAFAGAMTIGRLTGDRVVSAFGQTRIILAGGLLASCGFVLSAAIHPWQATLVGDALVGFGCANIVPVLFTAIGRQRTMPEAAAVPAVTTIGYAGILAGPAAIGFVAHATSLQVAFLILAAGLAAIALSARAIRPSDPA